MDANCQSVNIYHKLLDLTSRQVLTNLVSFPGLGMVLANARSWMESQMGMGESSEKSKWPASGRPLKWPGRASHSSDGVVGVDVIGFVRNSTLTPSMGLRVHGAIPQGGFNVVYYTEPHLKVI